MKKTSLRQVKIGAGKKALIYWFIPFVVVTVIWMSLVIYFPSFLGMSTGSVKFFKIASLIEIPLAMFVSFGIGYSSKKFQMQYLNKSILNERTTIRYYKKSIERTNKEIQERIRYVISESNLKEEDNQGYQQLITQIKTEQEKIDNNFKEKTLAKIENHKNIVSNLERKLELYN